MTPQRIQRRRVKGWRTPPGAIYVGRGSKWGNPFRYRTYAGLVRHPLDDPYAYEYEGRISGDGARHDMHHADGTVSARLVRYASREEIVALYRATLLDPDPGMIGAYPSNGGHLVTYRTGADKHGFGGALRTVTPDMVRAELRGRDLLCWCPLAQPCHADVLLDIANRDPE